MTTVVVIIALIVFAALMFAKKARLQKMIDAVDDVEQQIDVKLEDRFKTFGDLITIMKKYMDIERSTFREVGELKQKAQEARSDGDEKSRVGDEDKISRHVEGLGYAFEQHPELKADQGANDLYDKLVAEEGELATLKESCNQHIEQYNDLRMSLFGSIVAFVFSQQLNHEYEKWRINSDALNGADKYQVEL